MQNTVDRGTIQTTRHTYTEPAPELTSTVYMAEHWMEATTMKNRPRNISGLRKGKERFRVDPSTGEIIEYVPYSCRADNLEGLKVSFRNLRRIIFFGGSAEPEIVLTYRQEESPSHVQLYEDFRAFWKRLIYHYPGCEYVVVFEPQASGRFHAHLLVKGRGELLYIDHQTLEKLWGHGLVHIRRIRNVSKLAGYLSSKWKDPQRIAYYPAKFRVYRYSRGILVPAALKMTREKVGKLAADKNLHLAHGDCVGINAKGVSGEEVQLNIITHEYFRR